LSSQSKLVYPIRRRRSKEKKRENKLLQIAEQQGLESKKLLFSFSRPPALELGYVSQL
jgi:hypothetical protein